MLVESSSVISHKTDSTDSLILFSSLQGQDPILLLEELQIQYIFIYSIQKLIAPVAVLSLSSSWTQTSLLSPAADTFNIKKPYKTHKNP